MTAKALIATRVTADKKRRFAALAHQQELTESALLKRLIDGALGLAAPAGPPSVSAVQPVPATGKVSVRLRPDDLLLLRERAIGRSIPTGTYVSLLVRSHLRSLTPLPTAEFEALRKCLLECGAIGRNLNQIARALNSGERNSGPSQGELLALLRAMTGLKDAIRGLLVSNARSWEVGYEKESH